MLFRVFGESPLGERGSGPGEEEGERSEFKGRDTRRQLKTYQGNKTSLFLLKFVKLLTVFGQTLLVKQILI